MLVDPLVPTTAVASNETLDDPCGRWHPLHLIRVPDTGAGMLASCADPVNVDKMSPPGSADSTPWHPPHTALPVLSRDAPTASDLGLPSASPSCGV